MPEPADLKSSHSMNFEERPPSVFMEEAGRYLAQIERSVTAALVDLRRQYNHVMLVPAARVAANPLSPPSALWSNELLAFAMKLKVMKALAEAFHKSSHVAGVRLNGQTDAIRQLQTQLATLQRDIDRISALAWKREHPAAGAQVRLPGGPKPTQPPPRLSGLAPFRRG